MSISLTPSSFREYPVWKWNESQDGVEPVFNWDPIRSDEPTLFIKADFIAADGTKFEGYLVGLKSFHAFGLFVGDEEYVLNINLPEFIDMDLQAIRKQLGKSELNLFPLEYKTEVSFEDHKKLAGTITF